MKTGSVEDINVLVQVVLGETSMSLRRLGGIEHGSIIQLESWAGEPVGLYAAGELIARGEVVVIDENFGIRVTELLDGGGAR